MFFQIYKTTLKNILRSKTVYFLFIIMMAIAIYDASSASYSYYDMHLGETIFDTDPRYVLEFKIYIQEISNSCTSMLMYSIPLFAVITTVLILNRDYGDNYFEIEKTENVKALSYLSARFLAILSVNFAVSTFVVLLAFYWYLLSRGGVADMEVLEIAIDSIIRLSRVIVMRVFPCVLFYVSFTYIIGNIAKSGIAGAIVGVGYVVVNYAATLMLRFRVNPFYFDSLSPIPNKLKTYLHYFDTEWFEKSLQNFETDHISAIICMSVLLGVSLIYFVFSFLIINRREI